jgi:lysophospholipase L1-like esterase
MLLSFDSASTANIYKYEGIRNVRQNLEYVTPLTGLNMFGSIACLGDSYTQGFIVKSDSSAMIAHKPYPAVLQDRLGITVDNYGVGGTTAKSYITHTDGLPTVLNASAHDLYMICFGINDSGQSVTIGTVADINDSDYTQNADTFCGNLGKMYQMLVEQFPNARFVFIGNWGVGLWYAAYSPYAKAMQKVAEHFNVPYVDPLDDPFFYSDIFTHDVGGHPTQVGYTGIAYAVERLMAKCIANNYDYYKYAGVETV